MRTTSSNSLTGRRANPGERGGVLVLALVVMMAVTMLTGSFLRIATTMSGQQRRSADSKQAIYLAEAGLSEAYVGLGMAKTGNVGTLAEPATYGNGLFWVEATERADGLVGLESTALWGSGRATLAMVVERVELNPARLGAFSGSAVSLDEGSYIDSYDSSAGPYADQLAAGENNDLATFSSNGGITLSGGTTGIEVRGDVAPGHGASLTQSGTVSVSGTTTSQPSAVPLPEIEVPTFAVGPGIFHRGATPLVLAAEELGYESIHVGQNSEVVVVGPTTLLVGSVVVDRDGGLQFDVSGGAIDVYVTESFDLEQGSFISNTSQDPTKLTIQVLPPAIPGARNVEFEATGELHASVFAPESEVHIAAPTELFGSVVADSLSLASGVRLHIDQALATAENSLPKFYSWRVVDIPKSVKGGGSNPFKLLGLDPALLPSPQDAHQDQQLVIDYIDGSGFTQAYAGLESGFDWTDVQEVTVATRDGASVKPVTQDGDVTATLSPAPPGTPTDWISDPDLTDGDLARHLVEASPLTSGEINRLFFRDPAMDPTELMRVVTSNYPMSDANVLMAQYDGPLLPSQVASLLIDHSPLSTSNLNQSLYSPKLPDAELRDVWIANSPVRAGNLNQLLMRVPPMNTTDLNLVLAAQ